jgi:hypothetical protein
VRAAAALRNVFLAVLAMLPSAAAGAIAKPPAWINWDSSSDRPKAHQVRGFTLTTSVRRDRGIAIPVLTVRSKGRRPLRVVGSGGMSFPGAAVTVFPANRPQGQPIILFRSYTGGAHCCEAYRLIEPTPKAWRVSRIGQWDGSGPTPVDVDGDGRLELLARDQRFAYRWASYAGSVMPPVVFEVRNGKLFEVSAQPRFKPLYVKELRGSQKACAESESEVGPCLGYVAIAARAGEAVTALAVLGRKPSSHDSWDVPVHCGGGPAGCAHDKPVKSLPNRHEAVVYFLTDLGYLRTDK